MRTNAYILIVIRYSSVKHLAQVTCIQHPCRQSSTPLPFELNSGLTIDLLDRIVSTFNKPEACDACACREVDTKHVMTQHDNVKQHNIYVTTLHRAINVESLNPNRKCEARTVGLSIDFPTNTQRPPAVWQRTN